MVLNQRLRRMISEESCGPLDDLLQLADSQLRLDLELTPACEEAGPLRPHAPAKHPSS